MFKVIAETPWNKLQSQIRAVSLLEPRQGEIIYPYATAQITLYDIPYDAIRPTSLYVLTGNLALQEELATDLASQGYDPLALRGSLTVQKDDEEPVGLIPPIIEYTHEAGRYLLDGLHRSYLGWQAGRPTLRGIHIVGIREDCPASVFPNAWEDIVQYETVPADPQLKRRYHPNPLSLRRDFSHLNGSHPRNGRP